MGALDGKMAVVTGGSRGIGRAIVLRLAGDGASVVFSYYQNQQAADELEKYLKLDPKAADAERIKGTIKDLRSKQ